jgi:hypothetical protein
VEFSLRKGAELLSYAVCLIPLGNVPYAAMHNAAEHTDLRDARRPGAWM